MRLLAIGTSVLDHVLEIVREHGDRVDVCSLVVVPRFDGWNDLQQLPMEALDVSGSGVANPIECVQFRSMVVVHDPVVDFVAARVARENAVRCAPICTVRIAETAEIHRAHSVGHPICCVVGVASEDKIGTTALQEIA